MRVYVPYGADWYGYFMPGLPAPGPTWPCLPFRSFAPRRDPTPTRRHAHGLRDPVPRSGHDPVCTRTPPAARRARLESKLKELAGNPATWPYYSSRH